MDRVSQYEIGLFAGRPASLEHILECLGRSKNELRHTMKTTETDLAAALADKSVSEDTITSLRGEMADVHGCRRLLRQFATEVLSSDADDRDFDEAMFASDPSAGLKELESLRESRRLPGARGTHEGRNYDDLVRIRGIFKSVRRENHAITREFLENNGHPPGAGIKRRTLPLVESPVFIGVPGEMIQLTTVEVMAVVDVLAGGGCYSDDEPGDENAMDVEEAVAVNPAPEPYVCGRGAGVLEKTPASNAFNRFLAVIKPPKPDQGRRARDDGVGLVGTSATGILKTHPQFATELGQYVSSIGLSRFYDVKQLSRSNARHTIDVSSWSPAQREGLVAFTERFRGSVLGGRSNAGDVPLRHPVLQYSDSDE
jgi:hypothetical protein